MRDLLSKYSTYLIVALLALLHSPFILSDPDTQVSLMSRGAWTDEGLNTIQVRNFVNHGYLSHSECDNLVKTPYFGFVLVPFYSLLGTHIWVGRLLVLACVLMTLFVLLLDRRTKWFGMMFALVGLVQFHLFHYSHYSLAEMMSISWIILGIYLLWRFQLNQNGWLLAAATACFSLAYYSKVTFAYVALIPFMVRFLQYLSDRIHLRYEVRSLWIDWGIQSLVTGFFAGSLYLKWYLPNKEVFDMIKENQGQGRYDLADAWTRLTFNLQEFILVDGIAPMLLLVPAVLLVLARTNFSDQKQILFYGAASWFLLEMHHLLLVNPPTRYLLPLFAAGLVVIALGLAETPRSWLGNMLAISVCLVIGGYHLSHYWQSLNRRTNDIRTVQQYLSGYKLDDATVLGVWGTTLAAQTTARAIPIWSDFNVKENPLAEYRPAIVFAEDEEADSGTAFASKQINLAEQADSVRQFSVWRYKVNVFWMKQK